MSYTFSRRDFMKYSAVAAVAVAGSSMFTGCGSFSNPNRPSAVYTATEDSKLTFGGKSGGVLGFGGTQDYQILEKGATFDASTGLKCMFKHFAVSEGCSCDKTHYQVDIVDKDGKYKSYRDGSMCEGNTVKFEEEGGASGMVKEKEYTQKLTITGISYTNAKQVCIRYFPRHNALGSVNDAYSDVYATWEITSLFPKA